ncbi:MAG TPA: hypothetical protein VED01_02845 [Burkholderiales bacterium]|nr:hypothetical protein [Burkholderiales bacterium]
MSASDHHYPLQSGSPRRYAVALTALSTLFALRVLGQALQRWAPTPALPPFEAFQGSSPPYGILLPVQLALLAILLVIAGRIASGKPAPRMRTGRVLLCVGGIYMAGSLARISIGLTVANAPHWFSSWIPALFHVVLAAYILVLAHYHYFGVAASADRRS